MTPDEIKRRRLAWRLSTIALAYRIGVHPQAVRHWEAGRRTPNFRNGRVLEAVFGLRRWPSVDAPRLCIWCNIVPSQSGRRECGACRMRRWRGSKGVAA